MREWEEVKKRQSQKEIEIERSRGCLCVWRVVCIEYIDAYRYVMDIRKIWLYDTYLQIHFWTTKKTTHYTRECLNVIVCSMPLVSGTIGADSNRIQHNDNNNYDPNCLYMASNTTQHIYYSSHSRTPLCLTLERLVLKRPCSFMVFVLLCAYVCWCCCIMSLPHSLKYIHSAYDWNK